MGSRWQDLPQGSVVGTSSNRRGAQLRLLRPDLVIQPIRGNVDTRLRKQKDGQYQAILLAVAGLSRLGLEGEIAGIFSPEEICPAPGQGALGIQTRSHDEATRLCAQLAHIDSADCVTAERLVLADLGGGCQLPVGAYAEINGGELRLSSVIVAPDASEVLRCRKRGPREQFRELAGQVADDLLARGARSLLSPVLS